MQEYLKSENHPFVALLYLVLLAFGGALVFMVIGFMAAALMYGLPENFLSGEFASGNTEKSMGYLKVIQLFATAGMFLVPPLLFARIESTNPFGYLKLNTRVPVLLVGISVLIMLASMPVLELTVELNRSMKLPAFLKAVEDWMHAKEMEMELLTKKLLVMENLPDLFFNLFMIAVLPAISEELMFRGAMQKVLSRWTSSYHWGIWLAAIIFSAIHVQFFGFFPRMLLGALFGYLLIWSNTIWIPILAHFINNALTVIAAYVYQRRGLPMDKLNEITISSVPVYILSFVVLCILLFLFYSKSQKLKNENESGLA